MLWRPLLRARGALDADWEWLRDFDRDEWRLEFETYALIEPSGLVHGLITLELLADVVYVEGLAAAPWNREGPVPRQILGCGSELMKHAVRVSLARGYEGRLALHSLEDPSTVNFYRQRIRMTELRVEPVGETMLRYFELSSKQALMLIGVDEP